MNKISASQTRAILGLISLRTLPPSYRTYLSALIALVIMVVLSWAPFGIRRTIGLFEEWIPEGHPTSAIDYIVTNEPTRPFSLAPFVFAQSLIPNSFAGHNLYMMLIFILKGIIVYKLMYRLLPQDRFLAFLTACLFVIYPADTGLTTFRALNIHTSIALGLLAIYWLVAQWQQPNRWRPFAIVGLQIISLGIYEVMFGVIFAAPILLLWLEKRFSRRLVWAAALWWTIPSIMAIRLVYFVLEGKTGYVKSRLASGTQANFTPDVVIHSLTQMYRRHFTAWGYAFDKMSESSPYLIYAILAGVTVAVAAWLQWQNGEATRAKVEWQRSLVLIMAGLILMSISFVPYLPTPYRNETFRVFYLSSLGAALTLATLIHWGASLLKPYGKISATVLAGFLVTLASFNVIGQQVFYVQASDSIQRMLAAILTVAPSVSVNTTIIMVDETGDYQDQWHMSASTLTLLSALRYIYFDDQLSAAFCTIGPERPVRYCKFRTDGILHYNEYGTTNLIPYQNAVIIRTNYQGGFELLDKILEEYVLQGDWPDYLASYDPHSRIDATAPPPPRAQTFFTCWPVNDCLPPIPVTVPQSEVHLEFDSVLPGSGWETPLFGQSTIWTINKIAVLNLTIVPGQVYAVQFSIAAALDPAILESLTLRVNNTPILLRRSTPASGAVLFTGVIPAEVIAANPNNTKLMFTTDHLVTPKELGLSEDVRALGVLFDWLRIDPLEKSARIEFDTPVSGEGWYPPDGSQAWTSSTESTLDLLVDTQQDLTVEFRISYALTDEIIDSLQVSANGVILPLELRRDEVNTYIFKTTITQNVLASGAPGLVHLKFTIAQTASPSAMGINNDVRELGLQFDWLEIRPASQP